MNQITAAYSDKALRAAFALHGDLTTTDCAWGYNATKEDFDRLYAEVFVIVRDELPDTAGIDEVCDTFWDYQLEQMNGVREIDWYL
jgi:hypothetical protein